MLANSLAVTTLVVTDLDLSKKFYAEQLGLTLLEETPFTCRFGAGKGSQISIRRGQPPASGPTVAHFEVDDIEAQVRDLSSRGVTFEEYETPKTVNFIAQVGPARGAWFKDPDGNVLVPHAATSGSEWCTSALRRQALAGRAFRLCQRR
jgi:catechol 2,3-dioxygenase-like lactoylglutathione lyase family enzyme